MDSQFDVLGIGNAIVDMLAEADDALLQRHNLRKGAMALMAEEQAEAIRQSLSNPRQVAGGAVANSCCGIASLGGKAAYIGKVKNDTLGNAFAGDMQKMGVHFETPKAAGGPGTAVSIIAVTPDGQRTMNTFLGASVNLEPGDMNADLIGKAKILFIEGYLWDIEPLRPALRRAAQMAEKAGRQVAFTLSDAWLIDRHRDAMRQFVCDHADILFANEAEIISFYQTPDFDEAANKLARDCSVGVITRSEQGSVIVAGRERIAVAAAPTKVVDTTGAGDLYAAGFLFGLARGKPLAECGRIASICAAEIISHLGARPETRLADLAR